MNRSAGFQHVELTKVVNIEKNWGIKGNRKGIDETSLYESLCMYF